MEKFYGKTQIVVCEDNKDLGLKSAALVAERMRQLIREKEEIRMVFAAGESQSSFLRALAKERGVAWDKVTCFNIDDFWDICMSECFTCGYQTTKELYSRVNPGSVHLVKYNAPDPLVEVERFEELIRKKQIDILCQGIGTSGHLALNEPFAARFDDTAWVKLVDITEQSKKQLREDPNFKELGYIPQRGITLTIPAILSASYCYTMVPLVLKKDILTRLSEVKKPADELPASILFNKVGWLFVDKDSCPACWK